MSDRRKVKNVNSHTKKVTEKLPILGGAEKKQKVEAYATIKGRKDNFPNKISGRLIKPSKFSV